MRTIFIATAGRSDYGIYRSVMDRFDTVPGLAYRLIVTGGHLSERSGATVDEIIKDKRPFAARIQLPESLEGEAQMAAAMAAALAGGAALFAEKRPDMLLVLGDRFEMFAIAAAAVPFNIPIAHIHGGELSFGAIDDVFRHAITKMAHLHFAATREYADRIVRMGEEPWRVVVSGAPGLDNLRSSEIPDRATLSGRFGIPLDQPPLLATYHPVTRFPGEARSQVDALLAALGRFDIPIVFTAPNADAGAGGIRAAIASFVANRRNAFLVENFGTLNYLAMLRESAAMVGNSSSGLIETPGFRLPTVNVGERQAGRTRGANVIDAEPTAEAIGAAISHALDPEFRRSLEGMVNPYGDGHAAERIVDVLAQVEIDGRLIAKRFYEDVGPRS